MSRETEYFRKVQRAAERRIEVPTVDYAAQATAAFMSLPSLRGFWPMNSVDASGAAYDLSGQGRTLTNAASTTFGTAGSASYAAFNGTTQYLYRGDEAGLDITGALTFGGWFYATAFSAPVSANNLIGKHAASPNFGFTLGILNSAGPVNNLRMLISVNGAATHATVSSGTLTASTWYFMVGRFTPSTEGAVFINETKTVNTTAVPASIFNNACFMAIGANSTPANYLSGRAAYCFLCAAALTDATLSRLYRTSRLAIGV